MRYKIFEADTFTPNDKDFHITSYYRTTPEDKQFVNNNAEAIQTFMEDGYEYANLGKI